MLNFLSIVLTCITATCGAADDLVRFFEKIEQGRSVTIVAIGGSITMESGGWADQIAEKFVSAYPNISVRYVNAGISGTGSNVGLFRAERDVLSYRPDLVFVEFAVNDHSTPDEVCLRNLESIVVRLKTLSDPPAVVFVQAAAEHGAKHYRHQQVAAHYGLLAIDLQSAVDHALSPDRQDWPRLFKDHVHPNDNGHTFYADVVWEQLQQYVQQNQQDSQARRVLPKPLSDPLILDATMIVPQFESKQWRYVSEEESGWWTKFFQGSLVTRDAESALHIPFYGRTLGVWLLIKNGRGSVQLFVNGQAIQTLKAGSEEWYYRPYVVPQLWPQDWHILSVQPLPNEKGEVEIRLGYLLVQSQIDAPAPASSFWTDRWPTSVKAVHDIRSPGTRIKP